MKEKRETTIIKEHMGEHDAREGTGGQAGDGMMEGDDGARGGEARKAEAECRKQSGDSPGAGTLPVSNERLSRRPPAFC